MKVKMLNTVQCAANRKNIFHKGRTYSATIATNQPNYKENGLVFVMKQKRGWIYDYELLINKNDYVVVEK